MQNSTKLSFGAILAATVLVALVFSSPAAFADGNSGRFDPKTQFPVGTTITFTSINGVAMQRVNFTKPKFERFDASFTVTAQVENLTRDGGVRWKVLSGVFVINGQTYTVTEGEGHMNVFDQVASGMDGRATGPDGAVYRWNLGGLAALYGGVVIVGLRGGLGTFESNGAVLRYHLAFISTLTSS